jgi:hypothetical protein
MVVPQSAFRVSVQANPAARDPFAYRCLRSTPRILLDVDRATGTG